MAQLFTNEEAPRHRNKPRKLMHVVDAGCGDNGYKQMVEMECGHCGYRSGWFGTDKTVTEIKRGFPCPECNQESKEN